jgi:hypothetical protein
VFVFGLEFGGNEGRVELVRVSINVSKTNFDVGEQCLRVCLLILGIKHSLDLPRSHFKVLLHYVSPVLNVNIKYQHLGSDPTYQACPCSSPLVVAPRLLSLPS